jgi:hypothetical protein
LSTLYEWVDWIGIGIWGGCFMISAGSLTIKRKLVPIIQTFEQHIIPIIRIIIVISNSNFTHSPRLISMSICAMLSGLALIIFYAWNLGVYNNFSYNGYMINYYGPEAYCYYYNYNDDLCKLPCTFLMIRAAYK